MSEYNSTKEMLFCLALIPIGLVCLIGIPTDDGMMFGYFWKLCGWAIQNGWHF